MSDEKKRDDYVLEMNEKSNNFEPAQPSRSPAPPSSSSANNPLFPILSYCGSSILMTVTNKYVLSANFNLNFFLICVQVCAASPGASVAQD